MPDSSAADGVSKIALGQGLLGGWPTGGTAAAYRLTAEACAVLVAEVVSAVVQVLLGLSGDVFEVAAFVFFRHGVWKLWTSVLKLVRRICAARASDS